MVLTWIEIKQIINNNDLSKLYRSDIETKRYHDYRKTLALQNKTLLKSIMHDKLIWFQSDIDFWSTRYQDDNEKCENLFKDSNTYKIILNDFPYDFELGVHHLLIWNKFYIPLYKSEKSYEKNENVYDRINKWISSNLNSLGLKEYEWFINYPYLQSVKDISHIHLLIYTIEGNDIINKLISRGLKEYSE